MSLLNGEPHLTLAARRGEEVIMTGGHIARAVAFAVEFTLISFQGAAVRRQFDKTTGLPLWSFAGLSESP